MKKHRVSLPDPASAALRELARQNGLRTSEIVAEALRSWPAFQATVQRMNMTEAKKRR